MLHMLSLPNVSSLMPYITKNPGKSNFLGCQFFHDVKFPEMSILGSQISCDVNPGQSNFPGTFSGTFLGSQLSREVNFLKKSTFSEKSTFPGNQLSQEVFPGKSTFPGRQLFCEVTFSNKSLFSEPQ